MQPKLTPAARRRLRDADDRDSLDEAFAVYRDAGVLSASVPAEYGGTAAGDLTRLYVELAAENLTACFVLTQQNGAVGRLVAGTSEAARTQWLPDIAAGRANATVGISHLSTSRQHVRQPPVTVRLEGDAITVSGFVPWSTAADRAAVIVTGGVSEAGEVLLAIPRSTDGVRPADPMQLLALSASNTGVITLSDVRVGRNALLAGPSESVMRSGSPGGTGSLTTSSLAVGLSQRAVTLLEEEARGRDEVRASYEPLRDEFEHLKADLLHAASPGDSEGKQSSEALRTRANSLALRSSQALMTASKGAGFVRGHPAERAVREAMFFLVWSCPKPVAEAAMSEFACRLAG